MLHYHYPEVTGYVKDSKELRVRNSYRILRAVVRLTGDELVLPMPSFVRAFLVTTGSIGRVVQAVKLYVSPVTGLIGRFANYVGRFRARQNFDFSAIMSRRVLFRDQFLRIDRVDRQRSAGLRRRNDGDLYAARALQFKILVRGLVRFSDERNLLLTGVSANVGVVGRSQRVEHGTHFCSPIVGAAGRARVHESHIKFRTALMGVLPMTSWAFPNSLSRQRVRHTTGLTRERRDVLMSVHHEVTSLLSRATSMRLYASTGSVFIPRCVADCFVCFGGIVQLYPS